MAEAKNQDLKTIDIWGTGKPVREWLFVEDGAKSLVKSLNIEEGNYLYNIGVNKGSTILEIAENIAKEFFWDGNFKLDKSKPDGVMKKTVDGTYGKKLLNWEPEVKLDDGIKKTVQWYIENYDKKDI